MTLKHCANEPGVIECRFDADEFGDVLHDASIPITRWLPLSSFDRYGSANFITIALQPHSWTKKRALNQD
jgi:hypothetical protein